MPAIDYLGLECNDLSVPEVVEQLLSRRRHARFAYLVTPNADHFARL